MPAFNSGSNGRLAYKGEEPARLAEAFDISIGKWKTIAQDPRQVEETGGPSTCGLWMLFYAKNCEGCPIFEETGAEFCDGLYQYRKYVIAEQLWDFTAMKLWTEAIVNVLERLRLEWVGRRKSDLPRSKKSINGSVRLATIVHLSGISPALMEMIALMDNLRTTADTILSTQ